MAVPARPVECVNVEDESGLVVLRRGLGINSARLRIVNVGYEYALVHMRNANQNQVSGRFHYWRGLRDSQSGHN